MNIDEHAAPVMPPPAGTAPPAGTPLATDGQGNVVTGEPPPPTQASWDRIWLVIIGTFSIICLGLVGAVVWEFIRSEGRVVDVATLKELFLFSGGFLTGVLARHLAH